MWTETPSGWQVHRLGDLCEIFDGPHATPKLTEEGPIFLGIQSLNNGRLELSSTKHLSESDFERWTRRVQPRAGDLVFSYETRLGEAALIPPGLRCCLGRRMGLLRPRQGAPIVSNALLYAYIGDQFQAELCRNTVFGSTVDRIPISQMHDFRVTLPPLPEQVAIVEILGALDDKIESNERVASDQLRVSRAWFEHIAPSAPRARLESMVHLIKDTVHPGASPDDAFEHFSIPAFDRNSSPTVDRGRSLKSGKTRLPVSEVSVLLSKLNPNHTWRCWWAVPSGVGQAVCSPEFVAMTAKAVPPEWLFAAIAWDGGFRRDVLSALSGTTGSRQRVKPSAVAVAEAPVFVKSSAEEWLALARPAFARIERYRVESRRLAAIRDALLPRLVSGRLRVPLTREPEAALETVPDVATETPMRVP